jgi:hypothetical protein
MSAYSDALVQLAILSHAQDAGALPADADHAIRALQVAVGQMLPADQAKIQAMPAPSYNDLLANAGYLEDMSQTASYDPGVVTDAANAMTIVVNAIVGAPGTKGGTMTAYDNAITDLNSLASPASYGWTPTTPTTTLVNAYNDLLAQVNSFSAADQATIQSAEGWQTLQLHGPNAATFDPVATQSAATSLVNLVTSMQTASVATFTPPTNNGGLSPGGTTQSHPRGVLSNNPASAVANSGSPPAGSASSGPAPSAGATSSAAITTYPITCPPGSVLVNGGCSDVAPKAGVSLGATVLIALGAIFLGGAFVFMFQPELIGMKKRNPVRKRRKKRKLS